MYKKKNHMPLILAVIVVGLVLALVISVPILRDRNREDQAAETEAETEALKYDVILYKTSAASVEFDSTYLKNDGETETILSIASGELVTFLITPKADQILDSVEIVDFDFSEIKSFQSEAKEDGAIRVNFVMPEKEVIITLHMAEQETELKTEAFTEAEQVDETETESETEGLPYGLTLHGVTADVITAYNGMFDDRKFLQAIGDALHIGSARSEYRNVTDVTFSSQEYTGERDSDKVYYYVYFNDDPDWKVLSTYYMAEDSYVFTIPAEEIETETAAVSTEYPDDAYPSSSSTSTSATSGDGSTGGGMGSYSGGQTTTVTTSFDIMEVSTTFLSFVGDEDTFYQAAFDYVLSKGMSGNIVGTMSGYEIDPEKQTAAFQIVLNTGGTISGKYNKAKDKYSFSGL